MKYAWKIPSNKLHVYQSANFNESARVLLNSFNISALSPVEFNSRIIPVLRENVASSSNKRDWKEGIGRMKEEDDVKIPRRRTWTKPVSLLEVVTQGRNRARVQITRLPMQFCKTGSSCKISGQWASGSLVTSLFPILFFSFVLSLLFLYFPPNRPVQ